MKSMDNFDELPELEPGKIYFLTYGGNTQVVGRLKSHDEGKFFFYDLIHYWNEYEKFHYGKNEHCVKDGITEIRRASKVEKMALINKELAHDCI